MVTITITMELTKNQYRSLMKYVLKKCDKFACSLPNFGKMFIDTDLLGWCEDVSPYMNDSFFEYLDDGTAFDEYKKKTIPQLDLIADHLTENYKSVKFGTNLYDREREIYVYQIDSNLNFDFFEKDGLFSWRYPNAPEDLCFYRNGQIYMEVIAHEQLCFFDCAEEELSAFLDELGVSYILE